MKHLFLDTATERAVIGLAEDSFLIDAEILPVGLQNSRYLLPALVELFRKHHLTSRSFDFISCGIGPGSYTGIRVGASLAQSMAFALKIPLGGFSSLEGFLPSKAASFVAVIDARSGGIYIQKGDFDGKRAIFSSKPEVIKGDQIMKAFQDVSYAVGPKIGSLKEKLSSMLPNLHWEENAPSLCHLAGLCYRNYQEKKVCEPGELKLLYLNLSQ